MDYHIITATSLDELVRVVAKFTKQDWNPSGSPFPLHIPGCYGQALTKSIPIHDGLFNLLKEKRKELAQINSLPAYCIASNKELYDLVTTKPKTIEELVKVKGFGYCKAKKYGEELLKVINTT
jgi:superfamily II DNA helicase RecQ